MEKEDPNPLRCAKAAMLLLSLGSRRNHQENETMKQIIDDLSVELAKERIRRKQLKFCSLIEIASQILVMFSLCALFLVIIGLQSC